MERNRFLSKKQWIIRLGISLLTALLLEGFLVFCACRHGQGEEPVLLWPGKLENAVGYTVSEEAGGTRFCQESNDPQLYFGASGLPYGSLRIVFGEPLKRDVRVQVYSTAGGEVFTENRWLLAGSRSAEFSVACRDYGVLRLDLDGDFLLSEVLAYPAAEPGEASLADAAACASPGRFLALWLLSLAAVCSPAAERLWGRLAGWGKPGGKNNDGRYGKREKGTSPKRLIYLDLLRSMAACFAVAYHVLSVAMLEAERGTEKWMAFAVGTLVLLSCNPLFLMVSGTLLVREKQESALDFWRKRLVKIALPLALFYLLYMAVFWAGDLSVGRLAGRAAATILGGSSSIAPHFWLFYPLIAIYLLVPLLRKTVGRLGEREEILLFGGIALLLAMATMMKYRGMGVGRGGNWLLFLGIFLTGHLLNQTWARRWDGVLGVFGLIMAALSFWIMNTRTDYEGIVFNGSILIVGVCWAMFALAVRGERFFRPLAPVLAFLGKHSFSVLLVHWLILYRVLFPGWIPGLTNHGTALRLIGTFGITLALSLAAAMVFDNLILPGILRIFRNIFPVRRI